MPELLEQSVERVFSPGVEIRAIDDDSRRATFVIATENKVGGIFGATVLRMSGVDLARFRANPVVLDTHDRFDLSGVIGRAVSIKRAGRRLEAEVEFAETERANVAWELVRTGFVKAASVGFDPDRESVIVLADGESNGKGEARIEGPARIVKKWELLEFSIVPVPADADTLKRGVLEGNAGTLSGLMRRILEMIEKEEETKAMAEDKKKKEPEDVPTGEVGEVLELHAAPAAVPLESEIATRDLEARAGAIRAITPRGLEAVADRCILENLPIEKARAQLLEEHSKRMQSVGTPEPADDSPEDNKNEGETRVKDLDDKSFVRALTE
jgi:hypothetical protein